MAKNFMSSVLDELMGRNRDALPTEAPKQLEWDDPEVCPYYLVCFCPHELFVNTKADLGSCVKFHDDQLRQKYVEEAPNYKKAQHEAEFIRFAEKMIADIEGKIKRGKMRIALANGPDGGTYAGPGSKNAERIALLTERINSLLEEAESAGCVGDVEKAQGLMKLCDQIKEERDQLKSNEVSHPWNPDKAMQVCEVCGSYLIIGEAQHRLDDHIMGKQHVGFAMLRKNLDDVRKAQEKRDEEERVRMEKEREKRWIDRTTTVVKKDEDKEKDRDSRRGEDRHRRDRDRDRDRGHDRDRKRHRSRSRDKGKEKDAEKAKDKDSEKGKDTDKPKEVDKPKDKERSERRRSRSRDKGKSRDRDRRRDTSRSRDQNKDRDRRSRRHDDDKKRSRRSRSRSNSKRTSKDKDRDRDRSDRGRKRSGSRHRDRKEKDKERGSSRSSSQRHTREKEDIDKEKSTTEKIVDEDEGPSAAKSPKLDVPVAEEETKVEMEVESSGLDEQVQNGNAVPEEEEPKTESPTNEDSVTTD